MQTIDKISASLKSDPNVIGILLTGSQAREDALPGADIDFWVLLSGVRERRFKTEQVDGYLAEFHFRSLVQARDQMRQNPKELYSHLDGKALYDPEGKLEELRAEAEVLFVSYQVPETERKAIALWLASNRRRLQSALEVGDAMRVGYLVSTSSWKILEGLWAANNKPTPPSGAVLAHLGSLECPLTPGELANGLFTAPPDVRAKTSLALIDWILPRIQ